MSERAGEPSVLSLRKAVELMDRLWGYGGWETLQTHKSLRPYLVEETYELLDAVDNGDDAAIVEELGDLLLQVLFHARIAEAEGRFTVDDVATALVDKLTHRSPHLAETHGVAIDVAAQEQAWIARKIAEKSRSSCLDGIALDQPALALAEKILSRAAKAGLPEDLVAPELRAVTLTPAGTAEVNLRAAALSFAARIRAAEAAAGASLTSPEAWRERW